jgi:serine/threonine protein kinase
MGTEITVLQTLSGKEGFGALLESAPWIPREVADIVDRAVAFSPDDRFSNAEELRAGLSKILHRRFPDFTPQYLADLVVRVQSASEEMNSDDEDSMTRAKLASFASKSRAASAGGGIPPLQRLGRMRRLALPVLLAALATGLIALYVGEHLPGGPPKPTDAGPAIASKETHQASREDDGQGTSKQVPPQNPVSVSKDTGTDSKPPPEPEESPTKNDHSRKRPIADRRSRGVGTVDINASPWADVSIDGVDYTTTPILGLKLPAGKHKATFVNPEIGITKTRTFEVKPDQTVRLLVEME